MPATSIFASSSLFSALFLSSFTGAVPFTSSLSSIVSRDGTGSVTGSSGLSWYDATFSHGSSGKSDASAYTCYSGPASSFPPMSSWMSFNAMWALQVQDALAPIGDSAAEQQAIYNAIVSVSQSAKVDARVILAVIIDESTGNVRVPCTTSYGGVHNCGLMQAYNSSAYDASQMQASVTRMVIDGTQGTAYGPGLVQLFNDAADTATTTSGNLYAVLRAYNSGKINMAQLSDGQGATPAYVSNIANYLQGWNGWGNGPSGCTFTGNSPTFSTSTTTTILTSTSVPTVKPNCASASYVAAPAPTVSGSTPNCCTWHAVTAGENCYIIDNAYNITLDTFRSLNTYVDVACDNLWAGYAYCMSGNVAGSVPSSSSAPVVVVVSTTKSLTSTSSSKAASSSSKVASSAAAATTTKATTTSAAPSSSSSSSSAAKSAASSGAKAVASVSVKSLTSSTTKNSSTSKITVTSLKTTSTARATSTTKTTSKI